MASHTIWKVTRRVVVDRGDSTSTITDTITVGACNFSEAIENAKDAMAGSVEIEFDAAELTSAEMVEHFAS